MALSFGSSVLKQYERYINKKVNTTQANALVGMSSIIGSILAHDVLSLKSMIAFISSALALSGILFPNMVGCERILYCINKW
jgi:hypothetical protein